MLRPVNQIAAGFRVLPFRERLTDGPDPSAEPWPRVNDRDSSAVIDEITGGGQTRKPGAHHEDMNVIQRAAHCCSTR